MEELLIKPPDVVWDECECCKIHNGALLFRKKCCKNETIMTTSIIVIMGVLFFGWVSGSMALGIYGENKDGFIHYAWIVFFLAPFILFFILFVVTFLYKCARWTYDTGIPSRIEIIDV